MLPFMERVLTEEQRESLRAAMSQQREAMRELETKSRDARRALMKVSLVERYDEETVRAKALELATIEAELTVLRVKAFSQMKPALSPEQIEQVRNPPAFPRSEGRFAPSRRQDRRDDSPRDENDLPSRPK